MNPMIESYFNELNTKMSDLSNEQRQDFLMELRAHVMDRLQQMAVPSDDDCRSVLKAMGTPDEIARQYRVEMLLKRSSWKISPISVLRTSLRWTVAGIQGYAIFVVALIGYLLSASFYITALLKPFFPHNIGLFVGVQGIQIATFPMPSGHDIAGPYYIPVAIIIGYLLTVCTTMMIRGLIRRGRSLRQRLA